MRTPPSNSQSEAKSFFTHGEKWQLQVVGDLGESLLVLACQLP
jgi:hypothetical protein